MTPELIGILSVGAALFVGLGGLTLALWRDVRQDLGGRVDALTAQVADVDRRLARLEGVIEGLAFANGRARPDRDREAAA